MADGDIYHNELRLRYQRVYRQVGEGHFALELIAHNALGPLRKDLKQYGDAPVAFMSAVAQQVSQYSSTPMLTSTTDWDALKQQFELQSRQILGNKRAIGLALDAIQHYLNNPMTGIKSDTLRSHLIKDYMLRAYKANFESPSKIVPRPTVKPVSLSHQDVIKTIDSMRPHIESYIDVFAERVSRAGTVYNVRLPSAPSQSPVDLDEDLG